MISPMVLEYFPMGDMFGLSLAKDAIEAQERVNQLNNARLDIIHLGTEMNLRLNWREKIYFAIWKCFKRFRSSGRNGAE